MLKQEPDPQEQSAGQMRVKKEEFARAIAALEARRQAEAQAQDGTVVIGDVLQQLQINVPADEVLQEIEAIHAGQPREESVRRPLWNAEQAAAAKLVAGIVLIPPVVIAIAALMLNPLKPPVTPPNMTTANSIPSSWPGGAGPSAFYSPSPYSIGPNQISVASPYSYGRNPMKTFPFWLSQHRPNIPASTTEIDMDEGGFNASSILKPLSEVPDNQPIHCTTASFNELLTSYKRSLPPQVYDYRKPVAEINPSALAKSSQLFDTRPNLHKPWILIKHDGKLYLRGWVAAKFIQAQAEGQIITIHSSDHSFDVGIRPQPITILIDFTQYSSFGQDFSDPWPRLIVGNVVLDKHAWEKW